MLPLYFVPGITCSVPVNGRLLFGERPVSLAYLRPHYFHLLINENIGAADKSVEINIFLMIMYKLTQVSLCVRFILLIVVDNWYIL